MGDRTTCYLNLTGLLNARHIDALSHCLKDMGAQMDSVEHYDTPEDALRAGEGCFSFYEVNWAELPTDLTNLLQIAKMAYTWRWDSGDEYPEGMTIYDPFLDEEREFETSDGAIMVSLETARNIKELEEIEAWNAFYKINGFFVFQSNHELLKIQSDHKINPKFFELHAGNDLTAA